MTYAALKKRWLQTSAQKSGSLMAKVLVTPELRKFLQVTHGGR
jgi:phage pi2 protein 07